MHSLVRNDDTKGWTVGFMTENQFTRLWDTPSMLEAMTVVSWLNGGEDPGTLLRNRFK